MLASLIVPVALASSLIADDSAKRTGEKEKIRQAGVCNTSAMMGASIKDKSGENLASIEDIVVNKQGHVQYLILGHGGVLGIGADYLAVPWKAVSFNAQTKELSLPMTSKELEKAPVLKKDNYQELHNAQWIESVHTFYRTEQPANGAKANDKAKATASGVLLRASQLVGANVRGTHKNEDGEMETLGDVNDLVMTRPGQIAFVVLGHGGTLELGETNIAVPWKAVKIMPNRQEAPTLSVDIANAKLKGAPVLKQENYAELTDRNFVRQTRSYFGITADREEFETEAPEQEKPETAPENQDN